MKDTKSPDTPEIDQPTTDRKQQPSAQAISSIQGLPANAEPKTLNWTHEDGSIYHTICQQEVQYQIEDADQDIEVNNNYPVTVLDKNGNPKPGLIDSYIAHKGNNTVIDYKTNDMSSWSVNDAIRFGHEHGSQIAGYVKSSDIPSNAKGYVLSVGKVSASKEVMQTYQKTITEHGVKCVFVDGSGEPNDVVKAVRKCMKQTQL